MKISNSDRFCIKLLINKKMLKDCFLHYLQYEDAAGVYCIANKNVIDGQQFAFSVVRRRNNVYFLVYNVIGKNEYMLVLTQKARETTFLIFRDMMRQLQD